MEFIMKIVLGLPIALMMYILLQVTSLLARGMAVLSVAVAAVTVNIILWTGSQWLIDRVLTRMLNTDTNDNTKEIQ
jgi:hypothetical protein